MVCFFLEQNFNYALSCEQELVITQIFNSVNKSDVDSVTALIQWVPSVEFFWMNHYKNRLNTHVHESAYIGHTVCLFWLSTHEDLSIDMCVYFKPFNIITFNLALNSFILIF